MDLQPKFIKNLRNAQFMSEKIDTLRADLDKANNQIQFLTSDILSVQAESTTYKGNAYQSYKEAVKEIDRKYRAVADWGVLQTGNIIDLRSAFIIAQGIKVVAKKGVEAQKEIDWAKKFLIDNDLDREGSQEFAKEAEIEGKFLGRLFVEEDKTDENGQKVVVRFVSWSSHDYKVKADDKDYLHYKSVSWKERARKWSAETLEQNEFVYKKFGGRIDDANEATPKIMKCLTQIDDLDKALRDLREIDRMFSSATPHLTVDNKEDVQAMQDHVDRLNWKIKKFLVHIGKLEYLQPNSAGVANLISEIETLSKMISGTTGVPIHFLGFLDLLKNRATGDNTRELIVYATSKERETWKGCYEEILTKAMLMYNAKVKKSTVLDPTKIEVDIPIITQEQWDHLEKVLLPACMAGKISDEYFQSQIPNLDVEAEKQRMQEKQDSEFEIIRKENADLKADKLEKDLFGGKKDAIPK